MNLDREFDLFQIRKRLNYAEFPDEAEDLKHLEFRRLNQVKSQKPLSEFWGEAT